MLNLAVKFFHQEVFTCCLPLSACPIPDSFETTWKIVRLKLLMQEILSLKCFKLCTLKE